MLSVIPPLPRHVRARCEATIERLIAFLDAHDAEPDDEPTMGACERHPSVPWDPYHFGGLTVDDRAAQDTWAIGGDTDERKEENENGGDINDEPQGTPDCLNCDPDLEPSLGAPNPGTVSGCNWLRAGNSTDDCEGA